jgi:serine/threonine-protein kinase
MGLVFEGRNGPSGQPLAVKILHPQLARSREMVNRFHREAVLLSMLNHPHVVKILQHLRWGEWEALITEWLPGGSLKGMLEQLRHWRQQVPFAWGVQYLWEASCGLAALHKRELVHRDIKPSNLLIGADGRLKVSDLGLARPLGREHSDLTKTGALLGSARYMAPEQWGDSSQVDGRADLYALGVTFYELLTGQLP